MATWPGRKHVTQARDYIEHVASQLGAAGDVQHTQQPVPETTD